MQNPDAYIGGLNEYENERELLLNRDLEQPLHIHLDIQQELQEQPDEQQELKPSNYFIRIKKFISKHPYICSSLFILFLILITGLFVFIIGTYKIKNIAYINAIHLISRDRPDFQQNLADINYLSIEDLIIIINGPYNYTTNDTKINLVMTEPYLFQPFGDKEPYRLIVGFGFQAEDYNSELYKATFYADYKNGTEVIDEGYIPKNVTKVYTGGFYYVLCRNGRRYISADPKYVVVLNIDELSFIDKFKTAKLLIHQDISNLISIYL